MIRRYREIIIFTPAIVFAKKFMKDGGISQFTAPVELSARN